MIPTPAQPDPRQDPRGAFARWVTSLLQFGATWVLFQWLIPGIPGVTLAICILQLVTITVRTILLTVAVLEASNN